MYIEIFSYVSSEFLAKIFKIPSKNIKKISFVISRLPYVSQNPNLHYPKIGTAGGNCIPYFCMLVYSGDLEPLLNIRMLMYSGDSKHLPNMRTLVYSGVLEAKETIGDGGGRKYANNQFSNQNRQSARCRLCRIAREARGERTDSLVTETHIRINSTGCEGIATTIMAAHHSIWRHLYDSMHAAQKPKSKLKFVTLGKE